MSYETTGAVNSVRRFVNGTNSADIVLEVASYVPACFANRPVTDPSNSRSPTSPTSLPMVKQNRCSVSIGSVWPAVGMSATTNNRHDLTTQLRHDDKRTEGVRRSFNAA